MIRINKFVRMLQLLHIVFCLILVLFIIMAIFLNFDAIETNYETAEVQRRITKVAIGFGIGVLMSHLIPYVLFWRRMKKTSTKKIKLFFTGSIWQWSLLTFLGLCLLVIFFIFPHLFVMGFFIALLIILLAKRPSHYRLLDKTKLNTGEVKF